MMVETQIQNIIRDQQQTPHDHLSTYPCLSFHSFSTFLNLTLWTARAQDGGVEGHGFTPPYRNIKITTNC